VKKIQSQKAEQSVMEIRAICEGFEIWLKKAESWAAASGGDEGKKLRSLRDDCLDKGEALARMEEMSNELEVQFVTHNSQQLHHLRQRFSQLENTLWASSHPRR